MIGPLTGGVSKFKGGFSIMKQFEAWAGFKGRLWKEEVNTRDFIQNNYTPYDGDASSLQMLLRLQISFGESCRS